MKVFSKYVGLFKGMMLGAVITVGVGRAGAQANVTSQINISTSFSRASGLALDLYGNLYVSDSGAGSLSAFAGANGSASTVLSGLSAPAQVAVDSSFNVYVANGSGNTVSKFPFVNGALNLNSPTSLGTGLGTVTGVAVDLSGNVYIVDNGHKQVVEISGTTQTTLLSGLQDPRQIAVDKYGNVYVADAGANAVVYLPKGGSQTTVGTGQVAPQGVAVDPVGNVYIADTGNNTIEEVPYSTTAAGPDSTQQATLAVTVSAPTAVAADTRGSLYIAGGNAVIHFNNGPIYFGLQAVNKTSQTFPVVFTFNASVVPATIKVLTQGLTGKDFNDAGGSTCTAGSSYSAGQTCTVNVTFKPMFAGARFGAIVFYDSSNNPILREFIGGGGLGPVLNIDVSTPVAPPLPTLSGTQGQNPYGVKPDLFGNLYIADTHNSRVLFTTPVVTSGSSAGSTQSLANSVVALSPGAGPDDIAINGAGDMYAAFGGTQAVYFFPNLNGTLSTTPITVASNADKYRIINVDIAGNAYACDNTVDKVFKFGTTAASGTQILSNVSTPGCLGIAVDLYGNFAISDTSLKTYIYVPANGGASSTGGTLGLSSPWGVAFDASGSIYLTDSAAAYFYRVPNEWGKPNPTDVQQMAGNKAYAGALDPYGNFYTSTQSTSSTYYNMLPRAYPYVTQAPITAIPSYAATSTVQQGFAIYNKFTSVAVGSTSAGLVTLSNSGTQAPTYAYSSGYQVLGDTDDFQLSGTPATVPAYATCSFANGLPPGQQCYIPLTFSPTSPGAVRSMNIQFPSNATYTSVMTIVGTAKGTSASTASNLAITPPSGSIYPTESITVMATAATAATGAVTLMVDGVNVASAKLNAGTATFQLSSGLTYGSHTLGVTYAGDATYAPVATPVTTTVNVVKIPPSATLVSNGNQANVGQAVVLTSTIATQSGYALPTGTITFYDGSTSIGTATLSGGIGSLTVTSLAAGTHTLTYAYSGDAIYASGNSSNSVQIVVGNYELSQTSLTVTPSMPAGGYDFGTTLTLQAQVSAVSGSGSPTGSVVFNLDGAVTSVALSATGTASATITPHAGSHVVVASYAGDTKFAFSNSSNYIFTTVKAVTTTALTATAASAYASSPITFTATVSSRSTTPTGTVTFMNGASQLGTVTLVNGVATLTTQNLPAGTDTVTAIYAGTSDCTSSNSPAVQVAINTNPTTITVGSVPLIVNFGQPTLTATIGFTDPSGSAATPSGSVTFYANGTQLGTVALGAGGSATYPASSLSLPSGTSVITATYSGDNYFAASQSTSYRLYIAPASGWDGTYSITASPNAATVAAGSSTSLTLTASSTTNYFGYVQFTCSGLPSFSTCQMANDQILLNGTNTPVSTTLVIYTTAAGQLVMNRHNNLVEVCGLWMLSGLPLMLCGFTRKGRDLLRRLGVAGVAAFVLLGLGIGSMTACTGLSPIAAPKGNYTVTINATGSGNVNTSAQVQLTVQ